MTRFSLCCVGAVAVASWLHPSGVRADEIEGGRSFLNAPVVSPGRMTDAILPRETLFYGVPIEAGERLAAQVTVVHPPRGVRHLVRLRVFDPTRELVRLAGDETTLEPDRGRASLVIAMRPVGAGGPARAGVYYLALSLEAHPSRPHPPLRAHAVQFDVRVSGSALSSPSPSPSASASAPFGARASEPAATEASDPLLRPSESPDLLAVYLTSFGIGTAAGILGALVRHNSRRTYGR